MKKRGQMLLFILSFGLLLSNADAYVQNSTQNDTPVSWTGDVTVLDVFINPDNTQALDNASVNTIAADSVTQWNGKSKINLRLNSTNGSNQENLNEIFFSADPSVFNGSGVVGITQVFFKNNTGEILEADILINDSYSFSTDMNDDSYLGNVLSHELGHFLGLGHSQVMGSTMFYALTRGQNQLAEDDKAGVYSIYPNGNSTKGSLTGKIVGGKSLAAVFGAHVEAISLKTGKIAGANISQIDGSFVINGLDKNDQYYIYTGPTAQVGLPAKYNNARYDFCDSSKKYRGSFFQQCGASAEGFPQAVALNSSSVNVGNVTIRCNLDVPIDYMQNKNVTPAVFDIQNNVLSGVGNTFTGYFSAQELSQLSVADYFKMDFSTIDWNSVSDTGNLYVELKVLNQSFYSPFKANVSIKRNSGTTNVAPKYQQQADGQLNLETITRLTINRLDSSDNDFEVTIVPETMEYPKFPVGLPYAKADYFPASSYFEDSLYFYLVTASIVRDNGDGTFTQVSSKNEQLSDNTQCPDAINTYALTDFTVKRSVASSSSKKREEGIACGTVDLQGGPGNGPGGFFIGLILSLILGSLTSSIIKQNKPKHYSKIA